MNNRKLLTGLLAALMFTASSVPALAQDRNYSTKDKVSSKNYSWDAKTQYTSKDSIKCTYPNVSDALKKTSYNVIKLTSQKDAPKTSIPKTEVKENKEVNNLSKESVSAALRNAMTKAQAKDVDKALRDQIKAEYEAQKAIEKANKELLEQAIAKQKQVRGYIAKVAEGKLTYTDEQLAKIDVLSAQLQTDVQAVIDKSAAIKTAKEAVKACMSAKDYAAALEKLKQETAVRQERGPALTKVNTDLDGILALLAEGHAELPTEGAVQQ